MATAKEAAIAVQRERWGYIRVLERDGDLRKSSAMIGLSTMDERLRVEWKGRLEEGGEGMHGNANLSSVGDWP